MDIAILDLITPALIIGARVSGVMLFAPFFGSMVTPARVKGALVFAFTILLYPSLASKLPVVDPSRLPLVLAFELCLGAGVGLATNLAIEGAQLAGQVLSVQMGMSLVNILDPQTQVDTTVMSVFQQTVAMLIFLQLDVHHWILRALTKSFHYVPPMTAAPTGAFTAELLRGAGAVLSVGLQIAAPVLIATLVCDVALGFLGKASPQMPLMLLGPAIKTMVGMFVLIAALRYWPALFERYFRESIVFSEHLMQLAG